MSDEAKKVPLSDKARKPHCSDAECDAKIEALCVKRDELESNAVAYQRALLDTGTLREALQEIADYDGDPNASVEDDFAAVQRIAEDALEVTTDVPRPETATPEEKP